MCAGECNFIIWSSDKDIVDNANIVGKLRVASNYAKCLQYNHIVRNAQFISPLPTWRKFCVDTFEIRRIYKIGNCINILPWNSGMLS